MNVTIDDWCNIAIFIVYRDATDIDDSWIPAILSQWAWSPERPGKVLVLHRLVLHGRTHKEANMAGRCGKWSCQRSQSFKKYTLQDESMWIWGTGHSWKMTVNSVRTSKAKAFAEWQYFILWHIMPLFQYFVFHCSIGKWHASRQVLCSKGLISYLVDTWLTRGCKMHLHACALTICNTNLDEFRCFRFAPVVFFFLVWLLWEACCYL